MKTVTVRRADQADLPAVHAFVRDAYGALGPFKAEHRWRWQFACCPSRLEPSDGVPVWIAVDGQKLVGQLAVQPVALSIDACVHSAGWIVDVMILPAYRGLHLGHRLHDAAMRDVPVLLMLTMAPATRRMAERGGAVEIGDAWQFSRWVDVWPDDVRRYLERRLAHRPALRAAARLGCDVLQFHRIFAGLSNAAITVRDALARRCEIRRDIAEVDHFERDIDELWRAVGGRFDALTIRDSCYLNWRFVACPDLRYRRFLARSDGRVVGYSVLRRAEPVELRLGVITEVFAAPDDAVTLEALLDHALLFFGADVAAVDCVTSDPGIARLLRARSFHRTRTTTATGAFANEALRARAKRLRGRWLFTKGDHDWDQIQVA